MLSRDLTAVLNTAIQHLVELRPLSVSMGNAIKFLKLQACTPRPSALDPALRICARCPRSWATPLKLLKLQTRMQSNLRHWDALFTQLQFGHGGVGCLASQSQLGCALGTAVGPRNTRCMSLQPAAAHSATSDVFPPCQTRAEARAVRRSARSTRACRRRMPRRTWLTRSPASSRRGWHSRPAATISRCFTGAWFVQATEQV